MPKAKKRTNANKRKNDAKPRLDSTKKKKSAPVLSEKPMASPGGTLKRYLLKVSPGQPNKAFQTHRCRIRSQLE